MDPEPSAASNAIPRSSVFALWVLVTLAVVSPWPFGSVYPLAVRIITLVTLLTAAAVLAAQALRGGIILPAVPMWPIVAFLAVGAFQLVPLPPALHAVLAPGSYEVWHPSEPAAAAVLGNGFRPISVDPDATWRSLAFTTGLVALALVAAPALVGSRVALRAAAVVTLGGLAVSVYGIVARALFGPLLYGRYAVPTVSPFGPFVSKNHFAGYVEMAALLAVGLALGLHDQERARASERDWVLNSSAGKVLLAYAAAAAMALGVLVSLSRGGLLSLLAGGLALTALRRMARRRHRKRRASFLLPWFAALVVGGTLVVLSPREAHERMLSLAGVTSEESGSFRLDTWRDTLRMSTASPLLGQGLGAFADAYPRYKQRHGALRVEHAENDYLELVAEGGALNLALVLFAVAVSSRSVVRTFQGTDDRLRRGISLGALAAGAGLLVHSTCDFNLHLPSNALLSSFLLAVVLSATGPGRAVTHPTGIVLAALFVFLAASSSTTTDAFFGGWDDARLAFAVGDSQARRPQLARAEERLRLAVSKRPALAEGWLLLGWLRAARGSPDEGAALGRWGSGLDPSRAALRTESERLGDLAAAGPRRTRPP